MCKDRNNLFMKTIKTKTKAIYKGLLWLNKNITIFNKIIR